MPGQGGRVNGTTPISTKENLPRIRTNQHQKQMYDHQFSFGTQQQYNAQAGQQARYIPPHRGGFSSRGGRGGTLRQAAAEIQHTIVRGYNKGKNIVSSVVGAETDQPECSHIVPDNTLLGDPPDIPAIFDVRNEPPDEAMEGLESNLGRYDHEADGHMRS